MPKKNEDSRDVFEKALDDIDAESPRTKRSREIVDRQEMKESGDKMLRGVLGTLGGVATYALGRKALKSLRGGRQGDMTIVAPLGTAGAGGIIGTATGDYPLQEARFKRQRRK